MKYGWREWLVVALLVAAIGAATVLFSHPPHATLSVVRYTSPAPATQH